MLTYNTVIRAAACRSCGAYGTSQHGFSCQPGRVVKQGRMRRAALDRRTSTAARAQARLQNALTRRL